MAVNDDDAYQKICQEDAEHFGPPRADERFISYRLDPDERPHGLDVRFLINVVSGDRAKKIDALQATAIKELLEWSREHRQQQEHGQQGWQPGSADPARTAPHPPAAAPDK